MKKKNSNVLITGGSGFIGSYVSKILLEKGYEVTIADNLSKKGSTPIPGCKFVNIDLTDPIKTKTCFEDADICINMASLIGGIGYFNKHSARILSENNKIFSSTFEAASHHRIKRMVYISSSMVYESTDRFPAHESDIGKIPPPRTGYGMSKLIGEYYCKMFKEEFGLKFTIIRPFNAYGINEHPGEYIGYSHVIPDLIKKMLDGQYPIEILGDGNQTRCFTDVRDIARGIVMAMESENAEGEAFNLGTDEETRIIDLAKKLWTIYGNRKEFKANLLPSFESDVQRRIPDVSKAKNILGWEPEISLDDGLLDVYTWLKKELIAQKRNQNL